MPELRQQVFDIIADSGFPSDDVAQHMHDQAAWRATDQILKLIEETKESAWENGYETRALNEAD